MGISVWVPLFQFHTFGWLLVMWYLHLYLPFKKNPHLPYLFPTSWHQELTRHLDESFCNWSFLHCSSPLKFHFFVSLVCELHCFVEAFSSSVSRLGSRSICFWSSWIMVIVLFKVVHVCLLLCFCSSEILKSACKVWHGDFATDNAIGARRGHQIPPGVGVTGGCELVLSTEFSL